MRPALLRSCWMTLLVLAGASAGAQQLAPDPQARDLAQGEEIREQALQAVAKMRADRRAEARPIDLISPFYSVAGDDETVLYLLNAVADPVRFELAAFNPKGDILPLGEFEIGVTRLLTLRLRELIRPAGRAFYQGTLRLSLIGDSYTVQAWAVVHRGRQFAEFQFQSRYKAPRNDMGAVWDSTVVPGTRPAFQLVNVGAAPLSYTVDAVGARKPRLPSAARLSDELHRTGRLEPGEIYRLEPSVVGPTGFVRIQHDGEHGDLRVAGMLEGRDHLSLIPIVRREDWEQTLDLETVRVSWDPAVAGSAVLTMFNTAHEVLNATVEAFDSATGASLLSSVERIAPGWPISLDVGERIAKVLGDGPGREVRLRVVTDQAGLLVTGKSRQSDGSVDDMTLLRPQDGHGSGSYPMLPRDTNEVFLTLLNLGEEPSEVVAGRRRRHHGAQARPARQNPRPRVHPRLPQVVGAVRLQDARRAHRGAPAPGAGHVRLQLHLLLRRGPVGPGRPVDGGVLRRRHAVVPDRRAD